MIIAIDGPAAGRTGTKAPRRSALYESAYLSTRSG